MTFWQSRLPLSRRLKLLFSDIVVVVVVVVVVSSVVNNWFAVDVLKRKPD